MNKKSLIIPAVTFLITFTILFFVLLNSSDEDIKDSDVSILFLGDFMIGDSYDDDLGIPFENLKTLFEDKDDIIVNLETSISDNEKPVFPDKTYTYNMKSTVLEDLAGNNVTIFNLANNHILDYGVDGFNDTMQYLQNYDLSFFGAGLNETQARTGTIKTYKDSIDIGYLGYFEYRETYDNSYHFYANAGAPGVAKLNMTNLEEDILKLKESADIVFVSLHIGKNYDINVSDETKKFAR
ncbi:CapA family protein, partial [Candidatus Babeliales bacterium]|nr:CapA family protein [Candidatus Babeliales bacterium]